MPCDTPRKDRCPRTLLRTALLEACLVLGSFAALSLALDHGASLAPTNAALFLALFVPLSYLLKALDVEYSDQLVRVALFQMGIKLFNVLLAV